MPQIEWQETPARPAIEVEASQVTGNSLSQKHWQATGVNSARPVTAHVGVPSAVIRRPGRGPVFRPAEGDPVAASCGCQGVVHALSGMAGPHPSVAVLVTAPCPGGHPDRLGAGVIEHFVPAGPDTLAPLAVLGPDVEALEPAHPTPGGPTPTPRRRSAGRVAGTRGRRGGGMARPAAATAQGRLAPAAEPAQLAEERRPRSPAPDGQW
jgi:hypothetical protein